MPKTSFQKLDFTLPTFYAGLLINGDESGLNEDELTAIDNLINRNGLLGGHWSLESESTNFIKYHNVKEYGILATDCFQFSYMMPLTQK